MATDALLYRLTFEKELDPFYFTNTGAVLGARDDVALANRDVVMRGGTTTKTGVATR